MTEPPPAINGAVIGGFLGVDLAGNVHPAGLEDELRRDGYVVDVEPGLAYESRDRYIDALNAALEARVRTARRLALEYPWDYFHLHIMETDRLYHFFWDEPGYEDGFNALLTRCEQIVVELAELARQRGANLVILSDHGFTRCRRIVFINALLEKIGLLKYTSTQSSFETIHPDSAAYALAPGRIFLTSNDDNEREALRKQISGLLRDVRDPETGEHPFNNVDTRESLYTGPHVNRAADLILAPTNSYDIKADFDVKRVFETPVTLVGTHTYDDAFYMASSGDSQQWKNGAKDIADAGRDVCNLLGLT
jgi:predicted AlkP superfamily phosphohydrolase/phosphomutase